MLRDIFNSACASESQIESINIILNRVVFRHFTSKSRNVFLNMQEKLTLCIFRLKINSTILNRTSKL